MYEESDKYRLCVTVNIHTIKNLQSQILFLSPPRLGKPNNLIYDNF